MIRPEGIWGIIGKKIEFGTWKICSNIFFGDNDLMQNLIEGLIDETNRST